MSDTEKFNVDSDLQSIADAMTVSGLNFCGGAFDHLETGEEFELTIAKKSSVRSMSEEIAVLKAALLEIKNTPDVQLDECPSIASAALAKLNQEGEE